MRGRTIIILVVVVLLALGGIGALLFLGGGDSTTPAETPIGDTGAQTTDPGAPTPDPAAATVIASDGGFNTGSTEFVNIYIALQDLPRGFQLTDEFLEGASPAVGVRQWPVSQIPVPQNAITNLDDLRDKIVRSDIPRESPILTTQVVSTLRAIARDGSDAALLLPPGLVAISMPLDPSGVQQVAYGLQPGDSVDIIFSFLFIEVDETFQSRQPNQISIITRDAETGDLRFSVPLEGRPEPSTLSQLGVLVVPQEEQRPRLVTQRTVSNALVMNIGYFPPDGDIVGKMSPTPFNTPTLDPNAPEGAPTPTLPAAAQPTLFLPIIITLGVEPQDALVLTWALDAQIPVTFVLRSANDTGTVATTPVTLQYIIETYAIPRPPLLPFALEPGLRSFTLSVFREFTFDEQGRPVADTTGGNDPAQQ
jgi:Flp pilus assembly protein CpaB